MICIRCFFADVSQPEHRDEEEDERFTMGFGCTTKVLTKQVFKVDTLHSTSVCRCKPARGLGQGGGWGFLQEFWKHYQNYKQARRSSTKPSTQCLHADASYPEDWVEEFRIQKL